MRYLFFLAFITLLSSATAQTQLTKKYKGFERGNHQGLRYDLFKPASADSKSAYPLIVYLHGSNDTISRDLGWYQEASQREHPAFVLAPKCYEGNQGWGNTWTETHSDALAKTMTLVDELITRYKIDKNRLYIYGISMGGFGVFSALAKEEGKFAAAYAVCGGSNTEAAAKMVSTPLWIFHGEIDDIVPTRLSRDVYKEIVKLGGKTVRYTEYPGVKHNSWENVGNEKTLADWLFRQVKGETHGPPSRPANFRAVQSPSTSQLMWDKQAQGNPDNLVWYYQLFKDNSLVAEIDGNNLTFAVPKDKSGDLQTYTLKSVNYFFKASEPVGVRGK